MSLDEMQEQIERYYIEMENELLLNIAKKIKAGKPMEIDKFDIEKGEQIYGSGGVNEWQIERLKELGGLNEENAKIIAKYSGKTQKEIEKIFQRAREIGTDVDKEILELGIKAGILNEINPILEDYKVKNILNASIREVLTTFNNQNNSLLTSAGNSYREIVNKVSSEVMSGTKTTIKAMQESVSKLSEKGLTGFTAKNGAEWSPEAYTKMVIRSNTQNTINRIQEERMQLAGNDYIEISSHLGARPLCSQDQGHIFSLSGNTTPIEDGNGKTIYPRAWSNSTYGQPAGILGINCGHSRYAFIPSLSIKRDVEFTKEENDVAYKEKQQQRLYERTIRNKKREISMLKEINAEDDFIRSKTKQLSNYSKEYRDFLDRTGRTRISGNEWIGTGNLSAKQKDKVTNSYQNWKIKQDKIQQQREIIEKSIIGKFDIKKYDDSIITTTKDVVLMPDRLEHIKKHPEVLKYKDKISDILNKPDYVYKQLDKEDTLWIIKQMDDNVKITLKLNTPNVQEKEKGYKNSIIQMQVLPQKRIDKYEKNGKIEKLFDKNEKK